jgi:hypothetical protein
MNALIKRQTQDQKEKLKKNWTLRIADKIASRSTSNECAPVFNQK